MEVLLKTCGISYESVAQRVRQTHEGILKKIRAAVTLGWDLSYSGMLRHDSRLLANGASYFGNWSRALVAAGINPRRNMVRAKTRIGTSR